jgi:SOS-response transcriptional repressor LexA
MAEKTVQKLSRTQAMNLAENLTTLMKKGGITDRQLSDSIGVPHMSIWRLTSGDTTDPRISTLCALADFFKTSIDALIGRAPDDKTTKGNEPNFIPVLDWQIAADINTCKIDYDSWSKWHPIPKKENFKLSNSAFALESKPFMKPRFPSGTVLIIDPDISPIDGDVVLVKILESKELTLRDLIIDPPEWQFKSITNNSNELIYNKKSHEILGVVVLTMLYASRF